MPVPLSVPSSGLVLSLVATVAIVGACDRRRAPPTAWIYDATLALGPRPPAAGGFGRGVRPIGLRPAGIVAAPGLTGGPSAVEELLAADDGAAEAVAFGATTDGLTIELVDVDAGVVRWRNTTAVMSPRAFGGEVVIAGDDNRTVGIDRATGIDRWRLDGAYRARDGRTVALATRDGVVIVDSATGSAAAPMIAPDEWPPGAVIAVCASPALHLFAYRNGRLSRWDLDGDRLRTLWQIDAAAPSRTDACGETLLVVGGEPRAAMALDPGTGAALGGPIAARDLWPARHGDGVELATPEGIEARDRRLGSPRPLEPARVGRLIARRGGRRLAARGDGGLVLLDDHGARALAEPFGTSRAALGDRFVIGGPWALPARTHASRLTRWELPLAAAAAAPMPPLGETLVDDPPRIDLPAVTPLPAGVALEGAGAWAVGGAIVDGSDPARIYAHVLEDRPTETRGAGIAAFDLGARGDGAGAWRWHRTDACPPGMAVALAATARIVVCGARQLTAGTGAVRAVDRSDGRTLWDWRGVTVDAVVAASRLGARPGGAAEPADIVVVLDGARVVVLDVATGAERTSWRASDGWLPRVTLVRRDDDVVVVSYEHGHLVMRSAALGLRPFVSVEVRGVLSGLFAVGDRVAATLTDGTAYLIDTDGVAVAAAGLAPGWAVAGDLAAIETLDATGATGIVVAFSSDGIARIAVALPGSGAVAVAPRATIDGAPLAILGGPGGSRVMALTSDGRPVRVVDLPADAVRSPVLTTAVDGAGVVAVVLARPLRLVRLDLP